MFRRILAAALILILGGALIIAAWPQLFGLQRVPIVAHVVSLRALAACIAAAILLLLLVLGVLSVRIRSLAMSLAVLCLAFILVSAAVLSVRGFGNEEFEAKQAGDITVLSWNTLGPATTPAAVAKLALEVDADIVVLPETFEENAIETATMMKTGGSPMWVHTLPYDRISPARSTSLLTSIDLGEYDYEAFEKTTAVLPTVVATPSDGTGPTIIAVHAVAPIPGQFVNWPQDLALVAGLCAGENVIMAGDFNATIDHMAGLADAPGKALGECSDAAMATDNAAIGTWPTELPPLLGAPIDHVMATDDWRVSGMRVDTSLDESGSDHRPIVVQLSRVD